MSLSITLAFLLLVQYADAVHSQEIYIAPDPSKYDQNCTCCLTLSQFAEEYKSNCSDASDADVLSLVFLPGNHSLDKELHLSAANISMSAQAAETVIIECAHEGQLGWLNISGTHTMVVLVSGLHFVGCGGNRVSNVKMFTVEDTVFRGVEGGGTAIRLNNVAAAIISRSEFLFNGQQNYNTSHQELNSNEVIGGALNILSSESVTSNILIDSTMFAYNVAQKGGAIFIDNSNLSIILSNFSYNRAIDYGGVIVTSNSFINISGSDFSTNSAGEDGGVIFDDIHPCTFYITGSSFNNNHANRRGGVIFSHTINSVSNFNIIENTFTDNNASFGGVLDTLSGNFIINDNTFCNNTGGVLCNYYGTFTFTNSDFIANTGQNYKGILYVIGCFINIANCTFDSNFGSLYTVRSTLTIEGDTEFENGTEQASASTVIATSFSDEDHHEGGAITSLQSKLIFTGRSSLLNNQAMDGGAILAIGSTLSFSGEITVAYNSAAKGNGGGIILRQSELEVNKGSCSISSNLALRGGGIHATRSSSISVHQNGHLQFINNSAARNGGGVYLEKNAYLDLIKKSPNVSEYLLIFRENYATHGGAVYVADDTYIDTCKGENECFMRLSALYPEPMDNANKSTTNIIHFSNNVATEQGSNIFGGLLDRCIPKFESYQDNNELPRDQYYNNIAYLQNISNIEKESISSPPVQVCFCTNEGKPNCSYHLPTINVNILEKEFTVSLVAVDQVNQSVDASITIEYLNSSYDCFGENQQMQDVKRNCTTLSYRVISLQDNKTIILYAHGPCKRNKPSYRMLNIHFLNCTCPIGFMLSDKKECECGCDKALSSYVIHCDSATGVLPKRSNVTNLWVTYMNCSNRCAYVPYPNCPFDYCKTNDSINLNLPNGADAQCNNNRRGVLCGACQDHFSLSLGSTRCLSCPKIWPLVLVAIILAAVLAGVLLVIALLVLNMTVAVGLINSLIFYANVVSANSAIFFPSTEPGFPTVFVAWLNLDIGVDACFLNGLDAYIKIWLQFAFPLYVIMLVVLVIIVSEYSPRFAALIGKRDPVATLATLILLSYAKLLSTSITGLLFATLRYPDGERIVWLPDGNVNYFEGKHAVLAIIALLILIVIGIPFTLLIFLWQWLVCVPKWKAFKWISNTKLNAFISTYHEPYNVKYRYWPGLLLLVRVVLYITASGTVSTNPQALVLTTILLVGALILFKAVIGVQVHRKSYVDILETVTLFNLLALAAFSLYHFQMNTIKQCVVAYISTIITFILFVGVIGYHIFILIKKSRFFQKKANEYHLAAVKPEVTVSSLKIPSPLSESGSDDLKAEERNIIITETFTDEL